MLVGKYKVSSHSVIRDLFYEACEKTKRFGAENVFDYTLGNPSVPVPAAYDAVLKRLADDPDFTTVHGYSAGAGIESVREKIADFLKGRYGLPYATRHIFMASGAASAIAHALRCVVGAGEEVIVFSPFFPEYGPYIDGAGGVMKIVPSDPATLQIDTDAFEKAVTAKTAAVLLNSPCNPTGVVCGENTLKRMADILSEKQKTFGRSVFIVSDEPYREIVFDGKTVPYPSAYWPNTLSCYSFSKALSVPGDRIGYVAVSPFAEGADDIAEMCVQASRYTGHNCPTAMMQLAVAETMGLTADLSVYETNMNILYDAFTGLGYETVRPDGTFYLFVRAKEPDAVAFCRKAAAYNLYFVPGDSFGGAGMFRVAFCRDTATVERTVPVLERFTKEVYG